MHKDPSHTRNRLEDERTVRSALGPDEEILWWGRPRQGIVFRPVDIFMILFSIMWGGFAIFWEGTAIYGGAPFFFMLWGIPFVAVGLYIMFGRFYVESRMRTNTYYTLTKSDAVIIPGLFSRTTKRIGLKTLTVSP